VPHHQLLRDPRPTPPTLLSFAPTADAIAQTRSATSTDAAQPLPRASGRGTGAALVAGELSATARTLESQTGSKTLSFVQNTTSAGDPPARLIATLTMPRPALLGFSQWRWV